jgi:hypothetical protein
MHGSIWYLDDFQGCYGSAYHHNKFVAIHYALAAGHLVTFEPSICHQHAHPVTWAVRREIVFLPCIGASGSAIWQEANSQHHSTYVYPRAMSEQRVVVEFSLRRHVMITPRVPLRKGINHRSQTHALACTHHSGTCYEPRERTALPTR